MQTTLIVIGAVVAIVAIWLILVAVWMKKQSLIGSWVAALPDGTHVTLQFEGEQKGGIYKQLTKRDGAQVREFGHWTINIGELRLLIMASDRKEHPRFGVDTLYWVKWEVNDRIVIEGPDRPKWTFARATDEVKIDFGSNGLGEPAGDGGPAATADSVSVS